MPKTLRLNIAEPCHENWQQMTPQEQGRFCGSCQKTVVDFSMMSDQEVLNYFLKTNHNVCGRLAPDQLNREMIITEKKKRFSWAYVWNVLLATFLLTDANAQVKPKPKKPVKTIVREKIEVMGEVAMMPIEPVEAVMPITLKGQVRDEKTNEPLAGASVTIKGTDRSAITDTSGNFRLTVEKKDSLALVFSYIGHEDQTRTVPELTNWENIQVWLAPAYYNMKEVVVIGYPVQGKLSMVMGSVSKSCAKIIPVDTVKKFLWKNLVPPAFKNDVKIYPNPVVRGNAVQVNLALKQAGDYKLEVLNTGGQVMLVQPLFMQTKEQLVNVSTQADWSAGMYFIRISSAQIKNVYQGKFLLQ
jgi:hypothetical protein